MFLLCLPDLFLKWLSEVYVQTGEKQQQICRLVLGGLVGGLYNPKSSRWRLLKAFSFYFDILLEACGSKLENKVEG